MPNNNPSGANQPLNQHPLPNNGFYTVAADALLLTGLEVGTDYLLVPPPVEGGSRQVGPTCLIGLLAGATGPADWELVLKLGNGDEAILDSGSLSDPDAASPLNSAGSYWVSPEDEGIFIRFTAITDGVVSAMGNWSDVRNVDRNDTPLSENAVAVSPAADPGLVQKLASELGLVPGTVLFNTDDVSHDIILSITDGTNTFDFGPATTIAAGEAGILALGCLNLPPGFELQARLGEPQSSSPCYVLAPFSLANQGPARQDQGGAY